MADSIRFVPFCDMPHLTHDENVFYRGASWVYIDIPGIEYGEVVEHWGGTWSGGRVIMVRNCVRTYRSWYPARNLELFKDIDDVYRIFGRDDMVLTCTSPTSDWRRHTDSWYVEPHRRGGAFNADRVCN